MKWVVSVVTNLLPRDLRTVSAHKLNQISLSTKQKAAKPQRHRSTYILESPLNIPLSFWLLQKQYLSSSDSSSSSCQSLLSSSSYVEIDLKTCQH